MPNITLAIGEETLAAARAYAEQHQTTLNALVRDLLSRTVTRDRVATIEETFRQMDAAPANSAERRWTRAELHVRP